MTHFRQESPPLGLPPELGDYLARLEQRINELSERVLDLHKENVEPEKREDGMIRYADGTNWDPGFGKGLYLYTDDAWQASFFASSAETDPVFTASPVGSVTTTQVTNWDTAYGWGDHSAAGYLTSFTEVNDLTAAVTWANVPDANITESSVVQHETAIDALAGDVLIDQTTAATADGAQLRLTDADNTLTTYTVMYARQRNNAIQIGAKDPAAVQPDVNALAVGLNDTNGIANMELRVGGGADLTISDVSAGSILAANDTRVKAFNPVLFDPLSTAPAAPLNGYVAYADGTGWNPGSGEGLYGRIAGAWVQLGNSAEVNDLTAAVTWANVPDANITQTSVTQHQAAIDHGGLAGLGDDDHTIYLKADGTRTMTGQLLIQSSSIGPLQLDRKLQTDDRDIVQMYMDGIQVGEIRGDADNDKLILEGTDNLILRADNTLSKISFEVLTTEEAFIDSSGMTISDDLTVNGGDLLIDQTTAATADGAQIKLTDTDNTLADYNVMYVRQRNNAMQIGAKDTNGVKSDVNAIAVGMNNTTGISNMELRVDSANCTISDATAGSILACDSSRVKAFNPVLFDPLGTAPSSPSAGFVAYANGTGWDPGSGAGLYLHNGTAWVLIAQ